MPIRGGYASYRAFTLIEILIAITILMIVITAIYSTWIAIARAADRGERAAAEVQRARMAIRSVEGALSAATMFSQNVYYYSFDADTASSDFALLSFAARLPESFPGSGLFPGQPLRRVTFSVESDSEGVNVLVMRQQPLLEELKEGMEPYRIDLARNVSTFMLDFWDTNANDWAYDWTYTNALPKMVRVTLGTGGGRQVLQTEDIVAKVVSIPSETVTPEFQLASGGGNVQQVQIGADGLPIPSGGNNPRDRDRKGGGRDGGDGRNPGGFPGGFPGGNRGGFPGQPGQFNPRGGQGGQGGFQPGQGGFQPGQGGFQQPGQGGLQPGRRR